MLIGRAGIYPALFLLIEEITKTIYVQTVNKTHTSRKIMSNQIGKKLPFLCFKLMN